MHLYTLIAGNVPSPMGSGSTLFVPYQIFKTKEKFVFVGVLKDNMWRKFCRALDLKELAEGSHYTTNENRCRNSEELVKTLSRVLLQYSNVLHPINQAVTKRVTWLF
jgi:CoA:oxalate CoA-transferase